MSSNEKKITKKDLKRLCLRTLPWEHSWNYERQANVAYCYAMIPILKKLYGDNKEEYKAALKRHLELYNTTPQMVTLPLGISAAMEEERANGIEGYDTSSIVNVKTAMMGPLAAIGDPIFQGSLRVIAATIGIALAMQGNVFGAVLYLLIFNIPQWICRYFLVFKGYELGTSVLEKIENSGLMAVFTYVTGVIGLMATGAMTAQTVALSLNINFGTGEAITSVQSLIDSIAPGLLPLALFALTWKMLNKKVPPLVIMLGMIVFGIIGSGLGFLA